MPDIAGLAESVINLVTSLLHLRLISKNKEDIKVKAELKKNDELPLEVLLRDGVYYKLDGNGPYCTGCYDEKLKLIRVNTLPDRFHQRFAKYKCPVCKATYRGEC
ncbi:hypothetical protein Mal52_60670 [Symmachiella dynata]|uniref:Uncharacterized protein n=1 Tax=Symmachiella dynata TaxID=2527995 RepID=A0A517ZYH1_9PLAN|nr:hypothetical protein Mal52_60670 [Symmachiella dynata]